MLLNLRIIGPCVFTEIIFVPQHGGDELVVYFWPMPSAENVRSARTVWCEVPLSWAPIPNLDMICKNVRDNIKERYIHVRCLGKLPATQMP